MFKGNSKPQEKKLGLYKAPYRRNQLSNFEKKDSFWNNIPPGTCDPYGQDCSWQANDAESKGFMVIEINMPFNCFL